MRALDPHADGAGLQFAAGSSPNTSEKIWLASGVAALRPTVQHYPWGKVGKESLVARLVDQSENRPYAELWMGAHPKAPAEIMTGVMPQTLGEVIAASPRPVLGERTMETFGKSLPFLLKALSVNADFGLSIQAHPDRQLARVLHARDPLNYPDPNHKPELAIAVTPLTLLYNFRPVEQIRAHFRTYAELRRLLEPSDDRLFQPSGIPTRDVVAELYARVMRATPGRLAEVNTALERRFKHSGEASLEAATFLRLLRQYGPEDRGLAAIFILNVAQVAPGQAVFVGPNIPHAYLAGDLIEIMANSDNVVRAGLTNKFQDLDTLLLMMDYTPARLETVATEPDSRLPGYHRFVTPAPDFAISTAAGLKGRQPFTATGAPAILFCLEGAASVIGREGASLPMKAGSSVFVRADSPGFDLDYQDATMFFATVGHN